MGIFFWDRTNQPTLSGCIYGDISQRIQGGSLRMQSCYMGLSTRKLWESPISSTGSFMFISSPKWKEYGKIIQQKLAFLRPLHWQERMPPAHMRPGSSSSDIQKLGRGLLQALDHWRDGINFFAFEMCKYITPFIVSQSYSFHLELPSLLLSPIRHFSPISPANRRIDMRTKTSQVSEIHVRHIQNTFEMRMTLTQMNTHTHTQTLKMCSTF